MKSYILIKVILLLILVLPMLGCEQDGEHKPVTESKGKPGVIEVVAITPTPGGASIQYTLPDNDDLLYVKGVYSLANGDEVEVKSSFYSNFLIVEGLGEVKEHVITLYAVTRSETNSDPLEVVFTPLEPAFYETYRSLEMKSTFAGVNLKAVNAAKEDLAYLLLEQNPITKEWEASANSLFSAAENINYTVRGLSSDSTYYFGLVLKDRFENYTPDTLFREIKPWFEEEINSDNFLYTKLPSDAVLHRDTRNPSSLWDDNTKTWSASVLLTDASYTPFEPHMITINMRVQAQLSRLHIWDYPEWDGNIQNVYFARGAMRYFEVWGSNENKDELDSGWVKLGDFESIKPSGLPEWVVNNDDIEAGERGFDYEFDPELPKVQYIRIRCLENWEGGTFIALGEVEVYGNDGDDSNN